MDPRITIETGKAILGIEFGSTRIKAVLVDEEHKPIAQGAHEWENQLVDGLWTYSKEALWFGLQDCYASLRADVKARYDVTAEYWDDFAEMTGIEFVHINKNTTIPEFKKELKMNEVYYMLNKALK